MIRTQMNADFQDSIRLKMYFGVYVYYGHADFLNYVKRILWQASSEIPPTPPSKREAKGGFLDGPCILQRGWMK